MPYYELAEQPLVSATFVERPNRFVALVSIDGRKERAYLANPGRLEELLFPGVTLRLVKAPRERTAWTVLAVETSHGAVPLHTHKANDAVAALLAHRLVPGLEEWSVVRREATLGDSRFDFLLQKDGRFRFAEVKCCTLFAGEGSYFPDAPSERAIRHVTHLSHSEEGTVIFLVNSSRARWFLPDWHTDRAFTEALWALRSSLTILPLAVSWSDDLTLPSAPRLLPVAWSFLENHLHDRGWCIVTLQRDQEFFWIAEASETLEATCRRWSRKKSRPIGHAEKLRAESRLLAVTPLRSVLSEDLLLGALEPLTMDWKREDSRLIGQLHQSPVRHREFQEAMLFLKFRCHDEAIQSELGL